MPHLYAPTQRTRTRTQATNARDRFEGDDKTVRQLIINEVSVWDPGVRWMQEGALPAVQHQHAPAQRTGAGLSRPAATALIHSSEKA